MQIVYVVIVFKPFFSRVSIVFLFLAMGKGNKILLQAVVQVYSNFFMLYKRYVAVGTICIWFANILQ